MLYNNIKLNNKSTYYNYKGIHGTNHWQHNINRAYFSHEKKPFPPKIIWADTVEVMYRKTVLHWVNILVFNLSNTSLQYEDSHMRIWCSYHRDLCVFNSQQNCILRHRKYGGYCTPRGKISRGWFFCIFINLQGFLIAKKISSSSQTSVFILKVKVY